MGKAELLLLEGRSLKLGDTQPHTKKSWNNLIDLYKAWKRHKKLRSGDQNKYKLKILKSD
jgi:hypothetical protein